MANKAQNEERNRRQYERVPVTQPVKIEATLRGRFIDIMRLELSGVTVDMSRGGFLAHVDQSITPGVRCRVDFHSKDGSGAPESLWARVRRTFQDKRGYMVALEFDEPLKAQQALASAVPVAVFEEAEPEAGAPALQAAKK